MNGFIRVGDQSVLGDLKQLASVVSGVKPVSVGQMDNVTENILDLPSGVLKGYVHHVTPIKIEDGGMFIFELGGFYVYEDSLPYYGIEPLSVTIYVDLDTKTDRSYNVPPSTNDINFYEEAREGWGNRPTDNEGVYIYQCYVNSDGFLTLRWMFNPGVYKWFSFVSVQQISGAKYQEDGFKVVFSDQHTL